MKNYYDELEISKTASKEVIERVYKVLAKKYHPDTTQEADKSASEEKFKIISQAYEVLSNDEKRKKYDLELEKSNPTISYDDYIAMKKERDSLNNSLNNLKNTYVKSETSYNSNQQYSNMNNTANYTQKQYNQPNNTYHTTKPNTSNNKQNPNTKSQKKTYYYTNTGKPASAFAYYVYKIKEFFSNIFLLILAIIVILLALNAYTSFNIFDLF